MKVMIAGCAVAGPTLAASAAATVIGRTVARGADNLLGPNESSSRDDFDGRRLAPIRVTEPRDLFYGPVFTPTVSETI